MTSQSIKRWLADEHKMRRYLLGRVPCAGMRVELTTDGAGEPPIYAELTPIHDEDGEYDGLLIESNDPEFATLKEVYMHFRHQDMTSWEWDQWLRHKTPAECRGERRAEYVAKVVTLTPNERELYEAASDTQPIRGETLAVLAGHDYSGHIKGCLRLLVRIGLFMKRKGYVRVPSP